MDFVLAKQKLRKENTQEAFLENEHQITAKHKENNGRQHLDIGQNILNLVKNYPIPRTPRIGLVLNFLHVTVWKSKKSKKNTLIHSIYKNCIS